MSLFFAKAECVCRENIKDGFKLVGFINLEDVCILTIETEKFGIAEVVYKRQDDSWDFSFKVRKTKLDENNVV